MLEKRKLLLGFLGGLTGCRWRRGLTVSPKKSGFSVLAFFFINSDVVFDCGIEV